jgi:predicted GNAT family acetyltransferase
MDEAARRILQSMANTVTQNPGRNRFEVEVDGQTAVLEYQQRGERLALTHTEVPAQLSGKGIGSMLTEYALTYAREHGLRVEPECPFVARYIEGHPEYRELVAS